MILAAGVGQRLRPLTETCPKALIEVGGLAMLEIVLRRLIRAGVTEAVLNAHHLADRIADFLQARKSFGIRIELSREVKLLDTGGGLKKVAGFFDDGRPFFLHNVDAFSEIDLGRMYRFHLQEGGLASLAVQARESARSLLFDAKGLLCGWESAAEGRREWARGPVEEAQALAFNGIHVISPEIFPKLSEEGAFSITRAYLRLAGQGERIQAFRSDESYSRDIGTPEKLAEARQRARKRGLPF